MFKYDDISTEDTSLVPVYRYAQYGTVLSVLPDDYKKIFNQEKGILRSGLAAANHIINIWESLKFQVPEGLKWKLKMVPGEYQLLNMPNDILGIYENYQIHGNTTVRVILHVEKFLYWIEHILPMFYNKLIPIEFGNNSRSIQFLKECSKRMELQNNWHFSPANRMMFINLNRETIKRILDILLDKYGADVKLSYVMVYLMTGTLVFEKYGEEGTDVTRYANHNTTSFWSLCKVIEFWKSADLI